MLSDDMGENLLMYFAWSRSRDPSNVGYPHQDPVRRLRGSGIGAEGLSDDEALWIDRALSALKAEDDESYQLVLRVYRDGRSLRWLESRGHGDRRRLSYRLSDARYFLRGRMCTAA